MTGRRLLDMRSSRPDRGGMRSVRRLGRLLLLLLLLGRVVMMTSLLIVVVVVVVS